MRTKARWFGAVITLFTLQVGAVPLVWTNLAGGNWNVPSNWSPNQIPTALDDAYITNSGTYTVVINAAATNAALNLGGPAGTQVLVCSAAYSLNGSGSVGSNGVFTLAANAFGGTGDLVVNGQFLWSNATLGGSGTVTIAPGGTAVLNGSSYEIMTGRSFNNQGNTTWSGGNLFLNAGVLFSNAPGGTLSVSVANGGIYPNTGSGGIVANNGLFRMVTTARGTVLQTAFFNAGTVEVQVDTLSLQNPSAVTNTHTGIFNVFSNANLSFSGTGLNLLAPSATLSGAGGISLLSPVTVGGAITTTGTNTIGASSASINFTNGFSIAGGTWAITGGSANFNADGAIAPAVLNLANGTLGGSGALTVNAPMVWSGGNIAGANTLNLAGPVLITNVAAKEVLGRTVVNQSSCVWNGGVVYLLNGGALSNAAGGTFDIPFDGTLQGSSTERFNNTGLLRVYGTNGVIITGLPFNNSGTVEVHTGKLLLSGGGTDTGTFSVLANTTLDLSSGAGATNTLAAGSLVFGAGNVSVSGGTVSLAGALNVSGTNTISGGSANFTGNYAITNGTLNLSAGTANFNGNGLISPNTLNLSGGTLAGTNVVTVNSPINWTSGAISGANPVFANGGLNLSTPGLKQVTSRTLVNGGIATWTAGTIYLFSQASISNAPGASFNLAFDGNLSGTGGGGSFFNAGTVRKTAGTNVTTCSLPFTNSGSVEVQSGTVAFDSNPYIQTAGLTLLDGGGLTFGVCLRLLGGSLTGSGQIGGPVTNSATVTPGLSAGPLVFNGPYTQTTNGALAIQVAGTVPGLSFGSLVLSNTATLAGALNLTLTNGYYPAPNLTFAFLTNVTPRSGAFTTFSFPSNVVGMQLNYGANTAAVQVINVLPVIPSIPDQTNDELVLLSLNLNATDADSPAQTLAYSLTNSPANAAIDGSGMFSWTPTEAQGPGTNRITVVVTDNGTPHLTTTQSFQVIVREINTPPSLILPSTQILTELTTLNVSASATDTDIPANPLTFAIVSAPGGLTIDSTSGAISWTPSEMQGPSTNLVSISVTDTNPSAANATSLSTTNSFSIIVLESNSPPVLTLPANQTITELTLYTNNALATDPDFPANPLTFALVSAPTGMVIGATSGAITWTPTEAQGPSTNLVVVSVTDTNPWASNAKSLSITNSFQIIVQESNSPPLLTLPTNQTIVELTFYTNHASATDPDIPANPLTFALVSAPNGMVINAESGAITWTPGEAQGPSTNLIVVSVTDTNPWASNSRSLSVTNSFQLIVLESNSAPTLVLPPNTSFNELTTYSNNASATDPDIPANPLTFALVSAPAGMVINPDSGAITWTPGEAQGPSTNLIVVSVTDTNPWAFNTRSLSVTNSFQLVVNEVNTAPVVGPLSNRSAAPGQVISFAASATDTDLPTNTLNFSLVGPPAGASIGANSGLFTWRVPTALANTTNTVRIKVTDNGSPPLSGTNSFAVTVNGLAPVVLTPLAYSAGQLWISVTGSLGPDYILQGSSGLSGFLDLATNTPATMPFTFTPGVFSTNGFYRVRLNP